jgi:ABC-type multidrug transport system ATPase subunit
VSYLPEILPVELRLRLRSDPDVPIAQLSKGNQQKVALAQALGSAAQLTVLDEPFSGLDEPAAAELIALLHDARDDGRAVLISAHHPLVLADADAFHQLDGGGLKATIRPVASEPRPHRLAPARIVLRASTATASQNALTQLSGVRSVQDGPVSGQTVILTHDPDTLLRSALASGWSFVQGDLGPADPDETMTPSAEGRK